MLEQAATMAKECEERYVMAKKEFADAQNAHECALALLQSIESAFLQFEDGPSAAP